jgi:hypothetical protein
MKTKLGGITTRSRGSERTTPFSPVCSGYATSGYAATGYTAVGYAAHCPTTVHAPDIICLASINSAFNAGDGTGLASPRHAHTAQATRVATPHGVINSLYCAIINIAAFRYVAITTAAKNTARACAYGYWSHRYCGIHHSSGSTYVSLFSVMSI